MADPRDWIPGEKVTAALLNAEVRDRWDAAYGWTSYTPTWAANGGTPTVGNGTLTGRWARNGEVIRVAINLVLGSTSSIAGTSVWRFGYPPAASPTNTAIGAAMISDVSAITPYPAACAPFDGDSFFVAPPGGGFIGHTVPFTWGVGDWVRVAIQYEA